MTVFCINLCRWWSFCKGKDCNIAPSLITRYDDNDDYDDDDDDDGHNDDDDFLHLFKNYRSFTCLLTVFCLGRSSTVKRQIRKLTKWAWFVEKNPFAY